MKISKIISYSAFAIIASFFIISSSSIYLSATETASSHKPPVEMTTLDYVLGDFYDTELELKDKCIQASTQALNLFLNNNLATAMNKVNVKNFVTDIYGIP